MSWKKQSAEAGLAGLTPREAALGALWDETMVKKMPDPLGQILVSCKEGGSVYGGKVLLYTVIKLLQYSVHICVERVEASDL